MNGSNNNTEIEAKYLVRNLARVEQRLLELGATLVEPRDFEYNLRYDDPQGSLTAGRQVLRLRKFHDARLTYKGPGQVTGNALSRTEIEVVVSDFENTRLILETLGYTVAAVYEKYRAMYNLDGHLVTIDELPYGEFIEVEGNSPEDVRRVAVQLGLDPEKAIPASYQGLFEQLRSSLAPTLKNLAFEEFKGSGLRIESLGYPYADK